MSVDQPTPPANLAQLDTIPVAEIAVHEEPVVAPAPAPIAPPEALPESAPALPEPTPAPAPSPTATSSVSTSPAADPAPEAAPQDSSSPQAASPTQTVDAYQAAIAVQRQVIAEKLAEIVAHDRAKQGVAQSPTTNAHPTANATPPLQGRQPVTIPSQSVPSYGTEVSGNGGGQTQGMGAVPPPVSAAAPEWSTSGRSPIAPPSTTYTPPTTPPHLNIPLGRFRNSNLSLIIPLSVPAPITSAFGWRTHPITGEMRFHNGIDFGAPMGTPVLATSAGKVLLADVVSGYGLTVVLRHNQDTQESLYGHLSELFVRPGDVVKQGQVIGLVGSTGNSTGPHLHFEFQQLTMDGWVAVDPIEQLNRAATIAQQQDFKDVAGSGKTRVMLGLQGEVNTESLALAPTPTPLPGMPRPVPLTPTIVASFVTPSNAQPVSALVPLALTNPVKPELNAWIAPILDRWEEASRLPIATEMASAKTDVAQRSPAFKQPPVKSNQLLPPPPSVPPIASANRAVVSPHSAVKAPQATIGTPSPQLPNHLTTAQPAPTPSHPANLMSHRIP